jgi:pimeloyl-ACP methyl ester carboxylesterase
MCTESRRIARRAGRVRLCSIVAVALAGGTIAAAGSSTASASGYAAAKPRILLVHGAFADGSSWSKVTRRLLADGYRVVVSQIPLTSFADDVAAVQRDLRVLHGPTIVVGHSYGGAVITQAAQGASNVRGLVYVAAGAPDTGETPVDFNKLAPPLPSSKDFVPIDLPNTDRNGAPFVILRRDRFRHDYCQDCGRAETRVLAASEVPISGSAFAAAITGTPAWRQFPAWFAISSHDRIINPAAQRVMARRMDPSGRRTTTLRSSHGSPVSHAKQVTAFIERAAR